MHSQSQENIFPREVAESGILETLMMEAPKAELSQIAYFI